MENLNVVDIYTYKMLLIPQNKLQFKMSFLKRQDLKSLVCDVMIVLYMPSKHAYANQGGLLLVNHVCA